MSFGGVSDALAEFERVHTMEDYYDGPRRGIANFRGAPHLYESERDSGGYSEVFRCLRSLPGAGRRVMEFEFAWRGLKERLARIMHRKVK